MSEAEFYDIVLSDCEALNARTKRFVFEFDCKIAFIPGQFIIIQFDQEGNTFQRSYSIARQITDNQIELCVSYKEEGKASPILFAAQKGDHFKASLPQGHFTLPAIIDQNMAIAMIATGTGVVPFVSMVKALLEDRQFKGQLNVYFGCRHSEELIYSDWFNTYSKAYPNFTYTPVLSRETWSGAMGYVHPHYMKDFSHQPSALFFICGWQNMLKEARENIKSMGYTRQHIKAELYD